MADQKATAQAETTVDRNRKRSPSYPSSGLETCMKWTRRVWDAEKKSTTSTTVAAKAMGYNSLSGATRVALAAMKKFGLLLEEGAERVRVSDDAIKYFLQPDDEEKLKLLRAFALRPPIIVEVLSEAVDELPSDENLNFRLVTDKGFTEDAARGFIKALRETVRFAKLGPEHYGKAIMPPEEQAPGSDLGSGAPSIQRPNPVNMLGIFGRRADAEPPRALGAPGGAAFRFDWPDGTHVNIQLSATPGADTLEELIDYLGVFQKKLKRQAGIKAEDDDKT